jgi:hypothetical protein
MRLGFWFAAAALAVGTLGAWPRADVLTVSVSAMEVYIGDPVTVTVHAATSAGAPVEGAAIMARAVFSFSGEALPGPVLTDASGDASFTFTNTTSNLFASFRVWNEVVEDGFQSEGEAWAHSDGVDYVEPSTAVEVGIDIRPGSSQNNVNLRSNGVVQVAILGSADLDVSTVDLTTVAVAGAPARRNGNGTVVSQSRDVNGDGRTDVVVEVRTSQMQLDGSSTSAELTGNLTSGAGGTAIHGSDSVRIVGN